MLPGSCLTSSALCHGDCLRVVCNSQASISVINFELILGYVGRCSSKLTTGNVEAPAAPTRCAGTILPLPTRPYASVKSRLSPQHVGLRRLCSAIVLYTRLRARAGPPTLLIFKRCFGTSGSFPCKFQTRLISFHRTPVGF